MRKELIRESAAVAIAVLALTLSFAPAPAAAQRAAGINGFQPTGDYILELDGAADEEARIYRSGAPAVLVVSSALEAPVLLQPRYRTVELVNLLKMEEKDDGTIDLLPNPSYAAAGMFQVEGGDVLFQVDGHDAVLKQKPPLTGFQEAPALFEHSPEYEFRAAAYQPDESVLGKLRGESRTVRVQVFFGTWCPACGQMVPRIIKVAEGIEGSKIDIDFYGLPREFSGDSEASRLGVRSVPTGVVFVDGREVGRISGNDWSRPESALRDLLGS